MKRIAALAVFSLLFNVGEGCADLPALEAGKCGNGVVEPGEDCDGFPKDGCRPPGDALQCHFACAACPSGWGCDKTNDVCREPIGEFTREPTTTFEATSARLDTGDFNGDGKDDLLARSQPDRPGREYLRAFFFSGPGAPTTSLNLAAPAISPAVWDFDGDGRDDLSFITMEAGINVLLGRDDRTLIPKAFPRFPFPPGTTARFVRVNNMDLNFATPINGIPVLFAEMQPGKQMIALGVLTGDPSDYAFGSTDRPAGKMLADPIAANIIDGVDRECEEAIWGWEGEGSLQWLELCLPGNLPWIDRTLARKPKTLFTLPGGDILQASPVAADLNDDGHIDLLLDGKTANYVAFGRGDGTFSASPDLTATAPVSVIECLLSNLMKEKGLPFNCEGAPLAAWAPKKKDKTRPSDQTIVVFPRFVMGETTATYSAGKVTLEGITVWGQPGKPWTVALIDDLNGNGLIDVVAASSEASDIDFLNGTTSILFNPSRIRTDSPVRTLTAADYDGDLINDLGFVEIGAGGGDVDAIGVAYGRPAGAPENPLRLGYFPNIIQAKSAKASGRGDMLQLGIVYEGEANTDLIAILTGEGDRQLLAPFGVGAQDSPTSFVQTAPTVLIPGNYDGSGVPGVFLLGDDIATTGSSDPLGTLRAWFVPGRTGARFDTAITTPKLTNISVNGALGVAATGRSADLNGDKLDEVVFLTPNELGSAPRLMIASVKAGKIVMGTPQAIPHVATGPVARLDLRLADVDGDGRIDAIILAQSLLRPTVLVAFGDGAGGFDLAGAVVIPMKEGMRQLAIATVQLDTDPAAEVLIANAEGTFAINAVGRKLEPTRILPPADAVTSGDFDGDGLPDIALSKEHRVSIYRGVSR